MCELFASELFVMQGPQSKVVGHHCSVLEVLELWVLRSVVVAVAVVVAVVVVVLLHRLIECELGMFSCRQV
jgi:ABC-type uncharacterized transport system permease subunit